MPERTVALRDRRSWARCLAVHPWARVRQEGSGVLDRHPPCDAARLLDRRGRVTWKTGYAEHLPLPDGAADVVWVLSTIHHVPDVERALAEARRVLRLGGRFVAIERKTVPGATGLASHGWLPEQAEALADLVRAGGFVDVSAVERVLPRGPVLAVAAHRG